MAEQKGEWITVNHRHIFIPEGANKDEVVKEFFSKQQGNGDEELYKKYLPDEYALDFDKQTQYLKDKGFNIPDNAAGYNIDDGKLTVYLEDGSEISLDIPEEFDSDNDTDFNDLENEYAQKAMEEDDAKRARKAEDEEMYQNAERGEDNRIDEITGEIDAAFENITGDPSDLTDEEIENVANEMAEKFGNGNEELKEAIKDYARNADKEVLENYFNKPKNHSIDELIKVNKNESSKEVSYSNLVKFSNDDSEEYNLAKEYMLGPSGRGLAEVLSRPEEDLSEVGIKVRDSIIKAAKPSESNFTIYRTDDNDWLSKYKVNDVVDTNLYLSGSLDKDFVIPENKGKVKQKLAINIKKGDPILVPNNGEEKEVAVVKNKMGNGIKIKNIEKDEDGIPVYTVDVYR